MITEHGVYETNKNRKKNITNSKKMLHRPVVKLFKSLPGFCIEIIWGSRGLPGEKAVVSKK